MEVILEIGIGLVLTFAVVAVVVSSTTEVISAMVRMRSKKLGQGIARILDDQTSSPRSGPAGWVGLRTSSDAPISNAVLSHPLIKSLSSPRSHDRPPSYIDAVTFATALLDSNLGTAKSLSEQAASGVDAVKTGIEELKAINEHLGSSLEGLWNRADADVKKFRHEIEDWFDREMARVSGWYGRWAQWVMVAVALAIVCALNVSAVTVGKELWLDPALRSETVAAAEQQVGSTSTTTATTIPTVTTIPTDASSAGTTPTTIAAAPTADASTLAEIGLPVGWNEDAWPGWGWYVILHVLGMLLTAVAASFGAPFWFDLLNQLVNLRATGRPPATAADQRAQAAQR